MFFENKGFPLEGFPNGVVFGFDSKDNVFVSMSSNVDNLVKLFDKLINGNNNNYALAA